MSQQNLKKDWWSEDWSYKELFALVAGLLLTGFLQQIAGIKFPNISYPFNMIVCGILVCSIIILFFVARHTPFVRAMATIPAAIASTIGLVFIVILMGVIPQVESNHLIVNLLGLNRLTTHWAFFLVLIFFLLSLGLTTLKRITRFTRGDFPFVVNHLGLFIVLTAGIFGSTDIERVTIDLYEHKPNFWSHNAAGEEITLPFALYLKEFRLEEYPPKLALVDNQSGDVANNNGRNLFLIKAGEITDFGTYSVKVSRFIPNSGRILDGSYLPVNQPGAAPAALVEVSNHSNGQTQKGWISCGSYLNQFESLKLDSVYSLLMTIPEPKKFESQIDILTAEGKRIPVTLEVNKPFSYDGWKIYQLSYDSRMGKWSEYSKIELIRDPWLPYVYFGIGLLILGVLMMLLNGKEGVKTKKHNS